VYRFAFIRRAELKLFKKNICRPCMVLLVCRCAKNLLRFLQRVANWIDRKVSFLYSFCRLFYSFGMFDDDHVEGVGIFKLLSENLKSFFIRANNYII
jgi:hypothetical protein